MRYSFVFRCAGKVCTLFLMGGAAICGTCLVLTVFGIESAMVWLVRIYFPFIARLGCVLLVLLSAVALYESLRKSSY